ncbi:MAG: hypothetical protein IK012_10145 [Fibrobacter sp.]|uniref:hypothetical protein n=1 Tax=Fibrobacter sp. TaxID=35828 RepID=UPI0025B9DC18|nr:hypothetical protein [Fibrobacter sp.]MBR4785592.1 hypothetical protein [Fibrobacter sp.]
MNISKFGLGLSLAAVLGLMACGDDASSSSGPDDQPELSSSSGDSDKPESSSDKAKSSSSVQEVSSSSVEEVEPCTFAATDDSWAVSYKGSDGSNSANIWTVFEVKGEDLVIRDSIRYTGQTANVACRAMQMQDSTELHSKSMDGKLAGVKTCEGSTVVFVSTRTEKGYFASNEREAVHASVKKACDAAVNGSAFEKFPLKVTSNCNFTIDDPEWVYSYLDEGYNSPDSVIVKYVVSQEEGDDNLVSHKYSITPMPYVECMTKQFAKISYNGFCTMEGTVEASSSGNSTKTREEVFGSEQNFCKDKVPAVEIPPVEPDTSAVTPDTSATVPDTTKVPSGDMVSCDIPGVLGECVEFPAGSDEAAGLTAQCVSVMEGTLGTGCAK